jgi:hypothetical protein
VRRKNQRVIQGMRDNGLKTAGRFSMAFQLSLAARIAIESYARLDNHFFAGKREGVPDKSGEPEHYAPKAKTSLPQGQKSVPSGAIALAIIVLTVVAAAAYGAYNVAGAVPQPQATIWATAPNGAAIPALPPGFELEKPAPPRQINEPRTTANTLAPPTNFLDPAVPYKPRRAP